MKVDCVIERMADIVERNVSLYRTDFYKYDIERIFDEKPKEFVWFIRETGTHMLTDTGVYDNDSVEFFEHVYELYKSCNTRFYYVKLNPDMSGEVTESEGLCDLWKRRVMAKGVR